MLDMIRLRVASGGLLKQATLHAQLVQLEWAEEKLRLFRMFLAILLGFACLLSALLIFSALIVALSWATPYRLPTLIAMIVLYGFGSSVAWNRFQDLSKQGKRAFSASREELSLDADLLKSAL